MSRLDHGGYKHPTTSGTPTTHTHTRLGSPQFCHGVLSSDPNQDPGNSDPSDSDTVTSRYPSLSHDLRGTEFYMTAHNASIVPEDSFPGLQACPIHENKINVPKASFLLVLCFCSLKLDTCDTVERIEHLKN